MRPRHPTPPPTGPLPAAPPLTRRTLLKRTVGAIGATGFAVPTVRRGAAEEDVRRQILRIPGAGREPTIADMERVGELCLRTRYRGAFAGQTITAIGVGQRYSHVEVLRPLARAWADATGATIDWSGLQQPDLYAAIVDAAAHGAGFDLIESGIAWEGDLLGGGLAAERPTWVTRQIDPTDYVPAQQPPVGTWDGGDYRVAIDADTLVFNAHADLFPAPPGGRGGPIRTTWAEVDRLTVRLASARKAGRDVPYGIIDACAPGAGFTWYSFASRAAAYAKHPAEPAWLFDPGTMRPRIADPPFVRACADVVAALPSEPPWQVQVDMAAIFGQFLEGGGAMAAWWPDLGSQAYSHDWSVFKRDRSIQLGFGPLPGAAERYDPRRGGWERSGPVPNVASVHAFGGWGLYVTRDAAARGVADAAWDLAAHLGGADLALWMSCYPSGYQPYRHSSFDIASWVIAGYPADYAAAYLGAVSASLVHPNAAHDPRIPGLFRYYAAAEHALADAYAGRVSPQAAMDAAAAAWDAITDEVGRDRQIAAYQSALGGA